MNYRYITLLSAFMLGGFLQSAWAEGISKEVLKSSVREVPAIIINVESDESDPLEGFNRGAHEFNDALDKLFLAPVARGYRLAIPEWGRHRVSHAIDNIAAPVTFANNILQGDVEGGLTTFWRFVINSTLGIGGIFDVAAEAGLKPRGEDFGQTLAHYGVGDGAYIVLPLLGPTTSRDLFGTIIDSIANPFNYLSTPAVIGIRSTELVSDRESLLNFTDDMEENSFDPYATIKSSYLQKRKDEIDNGKLE